MDERSVKRGIDGMGVPRKRTGLVLRDTANTRDRNGQICSRLGRRSTANPPKVAQVRSSEKGKSLRPSMQSFSSGKEVIGSSRRTTTNPAKPLIEPRKTLTSQFETGSSVTSSGQDEPEISQLNPLPVKFSAGIQAEEKGTKSTNVIRTKVGKSNAASDLRSQRNLNQRPGLRPREIGSVGPVTQAVSSKYRLRNLRCNTISDAIPSSCSTSDSTLNRKKAVIKRGNSGEDSSSTVKGKKATGPSPEGLNSGSRNGLSISDARRSRNIPSHIDNSRASVSTKKSVSSYARGRFSSQGNENPSETNESAVESPGILCHASEETPVSRRNSYRRPDTGSVELCSIRHTSLEEYDTPHSLINQDGYSEVLLALERLEQDEELTDEQIHLLETNMFLDGDNFDHHRDMRLDIDNMSYEELLALEERIGIVSTALTEEALSDCLKRSTYQSAPSNDPSDYFNEENDIKCCICQEEYVVGDEVGTLRCTHKFHVVCIQDWLKQKNWCPICKGSAAQSNSSSSH